MGDSIVRERDQDAEPECASTRWQRIGPRRPTRGTRAACDGVEQSASRLDEMCSTSVMVIILSHLQHYHSFSSIH
jgi:hypothetical protein